MFGAVRHPYTQGLFRSMPMPGTNKNDNPLIPIPGQLPLPHERPNGCNFGPRCAHFVAGLCDQADVAMQDVAGKRGHQSRCLRVEAIDWSASARKGVRLAPVRIGPEVLEVDRLKKHYRVAASALFGGGEARTVKAVEDVSFVAREAEVLAIVGESGCGKSTLAKVLLGLETASEGLVVFDERGDPEPPGRAPAGRHDLLDPDDLPEPVRHPQSELLGRLAESCARSSGSASARAAPSGARSCCGFSIW